MKPKNQTRMRILSLEMINILKMSTCANSPPLTTPTTHRVIVVGSGLAGLSAATQLTKLNVPVILLDRAERPGGNSIKASSGINGAPTRFQPVRDDDGAFYADTVKSAGDIFAGAQGNERKLRERLIRTVTKDSSDAVYWLADEVGVDLSKVAQLGGHSRARTHRSAKGKPPGAAIVGALLDALKENPFFELRTKSRVTKVLKDAKEVVGVEYVAEEQTHVLRGPVVFASGGFAGDVRGMVSRYRPDLAAYPSTNEAREGSQSLLEEVGAKTTDMEQIQVHPTGFVDEKDSSATVKFLAAEALRGEGGILLLGNGRRFVNELERRDHVTDAITRAATTLEGDLRQWEATLLLDEGAAAALDSHMQFYLWKGLIKKTTFGELGQAVIDSAQEYADIVAGKKADELGRTAFGNWTLTDVQPETVAYVGKVTPVLHFTMGGVIFDETSQVLDGQGDAIPGLWAAGEVTGGLHGQNRLGGSSLLECAVFGRIAGNAAAAFYQRHYLSS
ncbi:FAD binding domain-containing protein [Aspergillus pseudoustus]|uniref:Fumarate reductase n=1 Tax=Aspergillus pseudoustus TaxID=1810923 RepID=A0ABR4JHY3_9EURO